jgi:hypothetical protein
MYFLFATRELRGRGIGETSRGASLSFSARLH